MNNHPKSINDSRSQTEIVISSDQMQKKYYGISFLVLLLLNLIYMIPHFEHYSMGGMQGSILLFMILVIFLILDLVGMFILAALLRKIMGKHWSKVFVRISAGAIALLFAISLYRATLPLPYLQFMIDKIPDAAAYFEEHKAELYASAVSENQAMHYFDDDFPSGPMVNMEYIYVAEPESYPVKTGQISRTQFIYPIDEQWYLLLYQGYAN